MVSCVQELMGSTSIAQRIGFLSRFCERDTGTMYIFLQAKFQLSGGILNLFFRFISLPQTSGIFMVCHCQWTNPEC